MTTVTSPPSAGDRQIPRARWDRVRIAAALEQFLHHIGVAHWKAAGPHHRVEALGFALREAIAETMLTTEAAYDGADAKRLYYLSMEFLVGRTLVNNFGNLGVLEEVRAAVESFGDKLQNTLDLEGDPPLGNGGLGRLAACFLDSLATLGMPGFGYGINYEYGLFRQVIHDGFQKEQPDQGITIGSQWRVPRSDEAVVVPIHGRIEKVLDRKGEYNPMWVDWNVIMAVPHDMPVVGYGGHTVNWLRLFSARASAEFDIQIFNQGDYLSAVEEKIWSERVSKVLYPSDVVVAGQELRLTQEYFLVCASLRDIVRRYTRTRQSFEHFASAVAIQMNDTHPALAVPELMRLLVDEYDLPWDKAWEQTVAALGYTNHTLLPEALERWPVELLERVVPRHMELIREIDRRFLEEVDLRFHDAARRERMSIVSHTEPQQVRMANLAVAGSHSVNGVAELHSDLLRRSLLRDFAEMWPARFNNKTNGVTPRRWLLHCNRELSRLITSAIGEGWITDLEQLRELERFTDDSSWRQELMTVKRANKMRLATWLESELAYHVNVDSMFDVQVKRIHEYKRQLLAALHVIDCFWSIVEDGVLPRVPRTFIFAGKAAPGYANAKLIIKLIHDIADMVRREESARRWMNVVFVPDYRVTLAELIIPAADLSEQISTAGKEASGTGNMKLALNGAVTIGTLDGANVEIMQSVGPDNIFIFGLDASEVPRVLQHYDPRSMMHERPRLARAVETLRNPRLTRNEDLFRPLYQRLVSPSDEYVHVADLWSYIETQRKADQHYADADRWSRMSLLNVARCGRFSSDRTIREYASEIWNIRSVIPSS